MRFGLNQSCWKILGLAATEDEKAIKQAYAKKVKNINISEDIEKYQILREAFEQARKIARGAIEDTDELDDDYLEDLIINDEKRETIGDFDYDDDLKKSLKTINPKLEYSSELSDLIESQTLYEDNDLADKTSKMDYLYELDIPNEAGNSQQKMDLVSFKEQLPNLLLSNDQTILDKLIEIIIDANDDEYLFMLLKYTIKNHQYISAKYLKTIDDYISSSHYNMNNKNIIDFYKILKYNHLFQFRTINKDKTIAFKQYKIEYKLLNLSGRVFIYFVKSRVLLYEYKKLNMMEQDINYYRAMVYFFTSEKNNIILGKKHYQNLENFLFDNPDNIDAQIMYLCLNYLLKCNLIIIDKSFDVEKDNKKKKIIITFMDYSYSSINGVWLGIPLIYHELNKSDDAIAIWQEYYQYNKLDKRVRSLILEHYPDSKIAIKENKKSKRKSMIRIIIISILLIYLTIGVLINLI